MPTWKKLALADTAQTISGVQTFSDNVTLDLNTANEGLIIKNTHYNSVIDFHRASTATARIQVHEPGAVHTSSFKFYTSDADSSAPNLQLAFMIGSDLKISTYGDMDVGNNNIADTTINIESSSSGDPKLNFKSTTDRSANIDFNEGGTLQGSIFYKHDGDTIGISTGSTNRTARLSINETSSYFTSKLGIGDTSPTELLEIASDSDPTIIIRTDTADQANSGKISFREAAGGTTGADLRYDGSANNFIIDTTEVSNALVIARTTGHATFGGYIYVNHIFAKGSSALQLRSENSKGIEYLSDADGHIFKTYDGSWKTRMTIADDGKATFTQNVSGDSYIQVDNITGGSSSTDETAGIRFSLGDGSALRGGAKITAKKELDFTTDANRDASLTFTVLQNNSWNDALSIGSDGKATFTGDVQAAGVYVGSTNTSYDFYNNGTTYLNGATTIDADTTIAGTVTIDVAQSGGALIIDNDTAGKGGIVFKDGGTSTGAVGLTGFITGDSTTDIGLWSASGSGIGFFVNGSGTRVVHISSDGKTGIGDVSPSYKLDIAGDYSNPSATAADTAVMGISAAASGSELAIGGVQSGGKIWLQNRHKSVNGYAYELAINPQGGDVNIGTHLGVGTTFTDAHLGNKSIHTVGYIDITGTGGLSFNDNSSTGYFYESNIAYIKAYSAITFTTYDSSYAERMRIDSTGLVGINKTPDTYRLDVAGNARFTNTSGHLLNAVGHGNSQFYVTATGQVTSTSTTGNTAFTIDQQGSGSTLLVKDQNTGSARTMVAFYSGSESRFQFEQDSSDNSVLKLRDNAEVDQVMFNTAGNSYISSTSGKRVHIGTIDGNAGIEATNTSDSSDHLRLKGYTLKIGKTSTDLVLDQDGNASFGQGNVNIGSVASAIQATGLHVATGAPGVLGNITIESSSNATSPPTLHFAKARGSAGSRSAINTAGGDILGALSFTGFDGAHDREGAQINATSVATSSQGTDMPADLIFKTSKDGTSSPAERLRIKASGETLISGPNNYSQLQIQGASYESGIKFIDSNDHTEGWVYANSYGIGFLDEGASWMLKCQNNTGIYFSVGETQKMQILNSGNVSIGNTNDTYKLDVSGTFNVSGNSTFGGNVSVGDSDKIGAGDDTDIWMTHSTHSYIENKTGEMRIVQGSGDHFSIWLDNASGTDVKQLAIAPTGKVHIGNGNGIGQVNIKNNTGDLLKHLVLDTGTTQQDWSIGVEEVSNRINLVIQKEYGDNSWGNALKIMNDGGQIQGTGGSAAKPTYSFIDQASTGMYKPGTSQLYFSVAGTRKVRMETSQIVLEDDVSVNDGLTVGNTLSVTGQSHLVANSGNSWTALKTSGAIEFQTSSADSSEKRLTFAPGGASDDGTLTIYKGDGATAGTTIAGGSTTTDNLYVNDSIRHGGDTDNAIIFGTDTQEYYTGGYARLTLTSTRHTSARPIDINTTYSDEQLTLRGTSPYIRFYEGGVGKAYLQWHSDGKVLLENQETSSRMDMYGSLQFYAPNDGGSTEFILDNNASAGSTDEKVGIRLRHASATGAVIFSERTEDFASSAAQSANLCFQTTKDGITGTRFLIKDDGSAEMYGSYAKIANATNPYLYIDDTSGAKGIFQALDAYVAVGSDSNHELRIVQNNATALTIDTSKRIGIGIAPSSKGQLSVYGNGLDSLYVKANDDNAIVVENIGNAPNLILLKTNDGSEAFKVTCGGANTGHATIKGNVTAGGNIKSSAGWFQAVYNNGYELAPPHGGYCRIQTDSGNTGQARMIYNIKSNDGSEVTPFSMTQSGDIGLGSDITNNANMTGAALKIISGAATFSGFTTINASATISGQLDITSGSLVVKGANDTAAYVYIQADNADNNADLWRLSAETDGMFDIQSKESGSWASVVEWSGSDKALYPKGNVHLSGTTISLAGTSSVDSYLRFDGSGGDTYLHYNANDMIDVYTGGDIAMRIKDDDVEFNGGVQIDGDLSVDGSFPFMIHASADFKGASTEKNIPLRPDGAANATVSTATDLDQQMTWVAPFNTTLRSLYVTTETAVSGCQFKVEVATNYAVYVNSTSTTTTTYTKNFVTASSANISAGLSISKGNAVRLSIDPNSTAVDQFLVTLIFE